MDDLLSEFLTETAESLDVVDAELVKFEQDPNDKAILDNIFRLVHTIKGTCGFLGLPRLETVAHHGETLLGKFRDGDLTVTPAAVTLILESLDYIKVLLAHLEAEGVEPEGDDSEIISRLDKAAQGELEGGAAPADAPLATEEAPAASVPESTGGVMDAATEAELEAAFAAAPGPDDLEENEAPEAAPAPAAAESQPSRDAAPASAQSAAKTDAPTAKTEAPVKNQSIRVNVDVLENLMTMVSELVLTRNQLLQMVRHTDDSEFKTPLQRLSNVTAELQDAVMQTRMQPIGNAWQKLPRIIRDISQDLGKKINLVMKGQDTELDRQVLELIKDPLTHMVRNSADHGLETPEKRLASGKSEVGTVTLSAYHEGGHIIIEVADDGAGLNTERIKEKAISNGVMTAAEAADMTDNQIHKLVFAPGFSTAAKVTNISGRGVGMDVVRTNIELIGGTIDLHSAEGKGSTFTIKIPLTLAIVSALIVQANDHRFAIPQLAVVELVRTGTGSDNIIETINTTQVLRLREKLLPLVDLNDLLGGDTERNLTEGSHFVVVMQVGGQRFGVVVDNVYDTEEIVVKPVASVLRDLPMFSGNTILGDGSVIMIVDPNGIAKELLQSKEDGQGALNEDVAASRAADDTTAMLIFRAGSEEPKAAPLSLVTRLEEIPVEKIETNSGANLVQYRGQLMPIIHADTYGALKTEGVQPILVFTDEERSMGLAVDEIVDIVDEKLKVELAADEPGVLGSAVVKGRATQIVDIAYYLTQAFADWFERTPIENKQKQRKRILLVDDNAFFRNMVAPLLDIAGYDVRAVESAEAALELRDSGEPFDLIVSDIEMPGINGFDFAAQAKSEEVWAKTPMLALSALQTPEYMARGHEAGFTDYVPKNDRDRLIAIIGQTLESVEEEAA